MAPRAVWIVAWLWHSMKPGWTAAPFAEIVRAAVNAGMTSRPAPTATIVWPRTARAPSIKTRRSGSIVIRYASRMSRSQSCGAVASADGSGITGPPSAGWRNGYAE